MAGDSLPPEQQRLLSVPPAQRDKEVLTSLIALTKSLADEFVGALSEEQQVRLAKTWRYQYHRPGEAVCHAQEKCQSLFVVLGGEAHLSERTVHHLEGRIGTEGFRRKVVARRGKAFGHFPLVLGEPTYGYSAVASATAGCSLLLIPRAEYHAVLRRDLEKQMADTVALLHANATFSS